MPALDYNETQKYMLLRSMIWIFKLVKVNDFGEEIKFIVIAQSFIEKTRSHTEKK